MCECFLENELPVISFKKKTQLFIYYQEVLILDKKKHFCSDYHFGLMRRQCHYFNTPIGFSISQLSGNSRSTFRRLRDSYNWRSRSRKDRDCLLYNFHRIVRVYSAYIYIYLYIVFWCWYESESEDGFIFFEFSKKKSNIFIFILNTN